MNRKLLLLLGFGVTQGCVCGGVPTSGIEVPSEISAVPPNSSELGTVQAGLSTFATSSSDMPGEDSDWAQAKPRRFVHEPALEQFDTIKKILKALAQTHYADAENVNAGPYKALISWEEQGQGGRETKRLQPWVVESEMMTEDGKDVNRVRAWIEEEPHSPPPGGGGPPGPIGPQIIRVEFKIYAAPTIAADGSYEDYGEWKVNAKFDPMGHQYFTARSEKDSEGRTVISFQETMGPDQRKAVMYRSKDQGYGKLIYPDPESCRDLQPGQMCHPTFVLAEYVYDADHLAVSKDGEVKFKDRRNWVELVHRYGMYRKSTGSDVRTEKAFGFPVQYSGSDGMRGYGYYGAWQGRHQLWSNGSSGIPEGTQVSRQDLQDGAEESYTVSAKMVGVLAKRALTPASLNDIKNIPVETWVHVNSTLLWDGANWVDCKNPNFQVHPVQCGSDSTAFTQFETLIQNPNDHRKHIGVNGWDHVAQQPVEYVYEPAGPSGAGFYKATRPDPGQPAVSTGELLVPEINQMLHVNIGGSIYIEFNGTGWVEKKLLSFDQQTWTPTFDETGDRSFTPELNREYYLHVSGSNYVATRTGEATYDVRVETQTVANPVNASTFLQPNTIFKPQWEDSSASSFRFITDPASPKFLKLVYETVGSRDAQLNASAGDIVATGQFGLVAYVNGTKTGVQFNWDYPREGEDWGHQSFLKDASGSYRLLDDPIRLTSIVLKNRLGEERTVALQFDGWLHGLPHLWEELRQNNFTVTEELANKNLVVPEGTEVTSALDSNEEFLVKPMEVSQFLAEVADPGTLDLSSVDSVDLNALPAFEGNDMGDMPQVDQPKYSEGKRVE